MLFSSRMVRRALFAIITIVCSSFPTIADAQTPVTAGFRDFAFGSTPNQNPTGEKPESKLWFNDGIWWGSLFNPSDSEYQIYRFNPGSQSWTTTGTTIDARVTTKADALWDEGTQRLYIVSHVFTESSAATSSSSTWGKLFRYSYSSGTQTYSLDPGYPVDVTRGKSEALTIVKDFNQRLWVAYVEGTKIKINWSLGDDATWGAPVNFPISTTATTVSSDDIAALVAFQNGDIGMMWSNQKTKSTYFSRHRSTDAPNVWQPAETVLPGIGCSGACADDHINLKTDASGRVFAILKTSLDTSGKPNQILAVRDSSWTLYTVTLGQENQTRGLVQLDEDNGQLYVIMSDTGGGVMYMKTTPMNAIGFGPGPGTPFIKSSGDTQINDATSMKQNVGVATGLLVLASDEGSRRYLHNYLTLGPPVPSAPGPPVDLTADAVSSGQVHLSWVDGSANELQFEVERADGAGPFVPLVVLAANTTSYDDTAVSPSSTYTYRVRASNGIGPSIYATTDPVTTPAPPGQGNVKVITFEGGTIEDPATGVDDVTGTVTVESSSPLRGAFSARLNNVKTAYLVETFTATPDLYLTFFLRLNAIPSSELQLLRIRNGSSQVGAIYIETSGKLRLKNNTSTVGSDSPTLVAGQVYRIGFHQRAKTGSSSNGVLEAFLAAGDDPFGARFAGLTNGSFSTSATEMRLGTLSSVAANLVVDDIKLDNSAMPANITGPDAPSALSANALTATSVELTWTDESADESAFHVERAGSNGIFIEIATVAADTTVYTDLSATPNTAYNYRVRGDNAGNFGNYSNVAPVTTPDVPPAAPLGLSAFAASSNAVVLSWTDTSSNETSFAIERAVGSGGFAPLITIGANAVSHIDTAVSPGTQYRYRIKATNAVGDSAYEGPAEAITPLPVIPPVDPSGLVASAPAVDQVQLTWVDNSATELLFRIERSTGGPFAEIGTAPADATTFTDTTVAAGTAYTYQVRATSGQLASGYSNQAAVTTPTTPAPPGVVLKLMTFESGTITDAVTGADSVNGTVSFETASPIKGARSAKINGSAYMQEDFTATSDLYFSFYMRLPALPSSDVRFALVMNGSTNVANLVLRSTGQLRLRKDSTAAVPDSAALTPGTTYRVLIHQRLSPRILEAFLAVGDEPFGAPFATSTESFSGSATRLRLGGTSGSINAVFDDVRLDASSPAPSGPPDAPTGLAVVSSTSSAVALQWTEAAVNEESIRVERSVNGGGFAELVSLGPNAASFTDTSVAPNTLYGYRVVAVNPSGSSPSGDVSTTTPDAVSAPTAPTGLAANAVSSTEVELTWTNAATTETSVHVERSTSGGAFVEIAILGPDATSLTDVFAQPGTQYTYRVRVANAVFSIYSNEEPVTTPP